MTSSVAGPAADRHQLQISVFAGANQADIERLLTEPGADVLAVWTAAQPGGAVAQAAGPGPVEHADDPDDIYEPEPVVPEPVVRAVPDAASAAAVSVTAGITSAPAGELTAGGMAGGLRGSVPAPEPAPAGRLPGRAVISGDLLSLQVDAIVNAAHGSLLGTGGVSGAILAAGGAVLTTEIQRRYPDGARTGEAVETAAPGLAARYVIHAVPPDFSQVDQADGEDLLRAAYRSALAVADGSD